jgi:diguanylate cyclase (GGDEF)-like protein
VQAVGRGEFGVAPVIDAPQEILALRDELAEMSASLHLQQAALAARADEAAAHALRLKLVTEFAREISSSLTLSHVLAAVASAGRRLVDSPRARVWLLEEDLKTLALHYDSQTGDVTTVETQPVGEDGVGRAVLDHRLYYSAGLPEYRGTPLPGSRVVGVPLVKGTRAIGVLEIALPSGVNDLDPDAVDILVTTAGHAATAIDAALLYTLAESLSRSDPLTGLANRRQLDADLGIEVERALRYERPLSFLMVDIDHFKEVNDTHGHALGDVVLREVAAMLRDHMRAGDTAYRYGGEEFAILARETDPDGGYGVAERLRQAIEDRYADGSNLAIGVTISAGLAALSPGVPGAEHLVIAADAALYEAKRAGRNRVIVAASSDPGATGAGIRAVS